jgi:hypothetical protein
MLLWNLEHDWVGLRHVERLAGLDGAVPHIRWLGPLSYLGQQALLHLGFWFIIWLAAMITYRPWNRKWLVTSGLWPMRKIACGFQGPSHWPLATSHYLWWFSAPMFVVFLFFSFKTGGGEPNWPVGAYISGLVLSAGWLTTQLHSSIVWKRRLTLATLSIACGFALAVSLLIHNTTWARPLLAYISGRTTAAHPLPLRRFDPTCRLRGWRHLAAEVDRLRAQLHAAGTDPVVATGGWSMPGELAFYCQDHPTVYSLGLALADRHSQYDLWRPNPIFDPGRFQGRTMIFVGEISPALRQAFAEVDAPWEIVFFDGDFPLARWTITVCRDFRGFSYQLPDDQRLRY